MIPIIGNWDAVGFINGPSVMIEQEMSRINFGFQKPAVYKITVGGNLSPNFSERIGGLQVNVDRSPKSEGISTLVGEIQDQSALMGILDTLFNNHLTIISVKMINDEL